MLFDKAGNIIGLSGGDGRPHISDTQGRLRENLADAGCGEELTRRFLALAEQGKTREALVLLAGHRKALLDCCHAEQKKIDCLDYLVYRMEKEAKGSP